MDATRFDRLAKSLAATDTRRRIVGLLAVLPIGFGGLLGALNGTAPEESAAKPGQKGKQHGSSHRRQRRKKRHKHRPGEDKDPGQGNAKKRKKRHGPPATPPPPPPDPSCVPDPAAQTCLGRCGTVRDNCGVSVACPSCTCRAVCPDCQRCDAATGTDQCVPDSERLGQPCGEPGQMCLDGGRCGCSESSCGACRDCLSTGFCSPTVCGGGGCCDGVVCQPGTSVGACGRDGGECDRCGAGQTCGDCPCEPLSCADVGASCGRTGDGCGGTLNCGPCASGLTCADGNQCRHCDFICTCAPRTCASEGANCGAVGNGCGDVIQCGSCQAGETCGGGGIPNVCGCTEPGICSDAS